MSEENTARNNKLKLLLLVLLCASPIVLSNFAFHGGMATGTVNYGDLLEVKPLPGNALNHSDDTIFRIRQLRGKWVMVTVDSGACNAACREKLYYMRQTRLMQHTEMDRVERLWLIDDDVMPETAIKEEYKGTLRVKAKDSEMLTALPAAGSQRDHIYLVDPLGNLMLRFPRNPDPALIAKDLKRLLKVSSMR